MKPAVSLKRCFLIETVIRKINEVFPISDFGGFDTDRKMESLQNEMNNFDESAGCDPNDIESVVVDRDSLAIKIGPKQYVFNLDKQRLVEFT